MEWKEQRKRKNSTSAERAGQNTIENAVCVCIFNGDKMKDLSAAKWAHNRQKYNILIFIGSTIVCMCVHSQLEMSEEIMKKWHEKKSEETFN